MRCARACSDLHLEPRLSRRKSVLLAILPVQIFGADQSISLKQTRELSTLVRIVAAPEAEVSARTSHSEDLERRYRQA